MAAERNDLFNVRSGWQAGRQAIEFVALSSVQAFLTVSLSTFRVVWRIESFSAVKNLSGFNGWINSKTCWALFLVVDVLNLLEIFFFYYLKFKIVICHSKSIIFFSDNVGQFLCT